MFGFRGLGGISWTDQTPGPTEIHQTEVTNLHLKVNEILETIHFHQICFNWAGTSYLECSLDLMVCNHVQECSR